MGSNVDSAQKGQQEKSPGESEGEGGRCDADHITQPVQIEM